MRDFHTPGRSEVFATNGMCATSHPLAAQVAVDMLKSGGNAVDAAIAGAVLLGLCEPAMTGIGGDCFVLLTPPGEDRVIALNGSGRAPAGLDPHTLRSQGHQTMPKRGAVSATVPGAIDAFCTLSEDWGRLGLADCLAPAIHYAEEGVPVAPRAAWDWANGLYELTDAGKRYYLNAGRPFQTGEIFRAPGQADVLRRVAHHGRSAFYEGEVAEDMVASLNADGGTHNLDDFSATRCSYDAPISGKYRGTSLIEHPPNGQGATAILLSHILEQFDIAGMDPWGAARVHIEAEATKLAYDARNRFIADPEHTAPDRLARLLAPETGATLAAMIDPERAMANPAALTEAYHKDTVLITVVDRDGMKVSLIYSIFSDFGCGVASEKFGILLQNRASGFNLTPGHPNEAGPCKRPMHTIIPALLAEQGRVTTAFGVMGGGYQPIGHARYLSNVLDFGMSPQAAIDAARAFFWEGKLQLERGYSDAVAAELAEMGHDVVRPAKAIGGAQAIHINLETGVLEGGSDPRKDGCALGY